MSHDEYAQAIGQGWETYIYEALLNGVDYHNCAWICDRNKPACHFFVVSDNGTCFLGSFALSKPRDNFANRSTSVELKSDVFLQANRTSYVAKYDHLIMNVNTASCLSFCWADADCSYIFLEESTCYVSKRINLLTKNFPSLTFFYKSRRYISFF